jgi:hypothetical protein
MAEKTLYDDDAVAEGDPADVDVCAIELGRSCGEGNDHQSGDTRLQGELEALDCG